MAAEKTTIQIKRHVSGELTDTKLAVGEPFIDLTTKKLYIGDGQKNISQLHAVNYIDTRKEIVDRLNEISDELNENDDEKINTKSLNLSYVSGDGKSSSTQPVYVDSNNQFQLADKYAGGTNITLNGASQSGSTASIYAPIDAPEDRQKNWIAYFAKNSDPGEELQWGDIVFNLNGTQTSLTSLINATQISSIYAPTQSGTSGQVLVSSGENGSPYWQTASIDISSIEWNKSLNTTSDKQRGSVWKVNANKRYTYRDIVENSGIDLENKLQNLFQSYDQNGFYVVPVHGCVNCVDDASFEKTIFPFPYSGQVLIHKWITKLKDTDYQCYEYFFELNESIDAAYPNSHMSGCKHYFKFVHYYYDDPDYSPSVRENYTVISNYMQSQLSRVICVELQVSSSYMDTEKTPTLKQIDWKTS